MNTNYEVGIVREYTKSELEEMKKVGLQGAIEGRKTEEMINLLNTFLEKLLSNRIIIANVEVYRDKKGKYRNILIKYQFKVRRTNDVN